MANMLRLLFLCLCVTLLYTAPARAQTWYEAEVLVFENIDVPQSIDNHWRDQAYIYQPQSTQTDTEQDDAVPEAFTATVGSSDNLGVETRVKSSSRFDSLRDPAIAEAADVRVTVVPQSQFQSQSQSQSQPDVQDEPSYARSRENSDPRKLQFLPEARFLLNDLAEKIDQSERYNLLHHVLWLQVGLPIDESSPVRISRGTPTVVSLSPPALDDTQIVDNPLDQQSSHIKQWQDFVPVYPVNSTDAVQIDRSDQPLIFPLDGGIMLASERFLHVYANLALTKKDELGALQTYILQAHRRMRNNELHYIDHPKFGFLIQVRSLQ